MVETSYSIIWSNASELHLKNIYDYIKIDSLQNADLVLYKLIKKVNELKLHPEKYNLDKYKRNNDNTFRAFEIYSFRVSYKIYNSEIHILRIRSTHQKPLKY